MTVQLLTSPQTNAQDPNDAAAEGTPSGRSEAGRIALAGASGGGEQVTPSELVSLSADALHQIGARWRSDLDAVQRVGVARRALGLVLRTDRTRLLRETLSLADNPEEWPRAADLFDRIRSEVLRHERGGSGGSTEAVALLLAEMTAKLAYNATSPRYPFDDTVIAWLLTTIHSLVVAGGPEVDGEGLAALVDLG